MMKAFISYSHQDDALRQALVMHLAGLQRQGKLTTWHDRQIEAGKEWETQIKDQLESAQIILLLVSPPFIASDYCYGIEMERAMERHRSGTARVIPIILRPCDWQDLPFGQLQALPRDAKPISRWDDQDSALLDVVQGIRQVVDSLADLEGQSSQSIGSSGASAQDKAGRSHLSTVNAQHHARVTVIQELNATTVNFGDQRS